MYCSSGFPRIIGFPSFPHVSCGKASRDYHCLAKLQPSWISHDSKKLLKQCSFLSSQRLLIHGKVQHNSAISTLLKDDNMVTIDEDIENIGIMGLDPGLGPYKDHLRYRTTRYMEQKKLIEDYEGGLEKFAQGYLKFGFNREEDGIVYREWAPAAQSLHWLQISQQCMSYILVSQWLELFFVHLMCSMIHLWCRVLLRQSEAKVIFVDYQLLDVAHGALDLLSKTETKLPSVNRLLDMASLGTVDLYTLGYMIALPHKKSVFRGSRVSRDIHIYSSRTCPCQGVD